jgi:sugar phosphate isomerase/epimerase
MTPEKQMNLSVTTDYARDQGDPSPYLRRIADAGFSHIHWCHHWNTDFLYSRCEVEQIRRWLADFGLTLLDLHASAGREKKWYSSREYEREAGVELVRNRIDMTATLGSDVIVMHIPGEPGCDPLRRSLDELEGFARERGVRIAIENGNFEAIGEVLTQRDPDYVGLCYDSGHGNIDGPGLDGLEALKARLIAIHLHDNDGTGDQHNLPMTGTVNWDRLTGILAQSAYDKCLNLEVSMTHSGIEDEGEFLAATHDLASRLTGMVDEAR